jgi:hypothetical protein
MPLKTAVASDGSFVFDQLVPGTYRLEAGSRGIVPSAMPITIDDTDVTELAFKVSSGVQVRGRVLDRLKETVNSVTLVLKPDPGNATLEITYPPNKPRDVLTNAEGEFSFSGVLPGKYTLEVNAPGGNSFGREIEVDVRDSFDNLLEVPFVQVNGRIVVADGSALPPITGSVRFVSSDDTARILFGFPDDAGRFSLLMAPGEYRLFTEVLNVDRSIQSIFDGSENLESRRFVVDPRGRQEIRIVIGP